MHGLLPARAVILAGDADFIPVSQTRLLLRLRLWTWGEMAFREQLRLGLQPMPHIVSGQRTLIQIVEICPGGHFAR